MTRQQTIALMAANLYAHGTPIPDCVDKAIEIFNHSGSSQAEARVPDEASVA